MNILFDISALAVWHNIPTGRRGIYRVVEETFNALIKETLLEVSSTEEPWEGRAYLKKHPPHGEIVGFRGPTTKESGVKAIEQILALESATLAKIGTGRSIGRRVARRTILELADLSRLRSLRRDLLSFDLADIQIFHQPGRFSIPRHIRECMRSDLARIMTVYDFIPFQEDLAGPKRGAIRELSDVLQTIGNEDAVICISNFVRETALERLKLPPEQVFVAQLAACHKTFHRCSDTSRLQEMRTKYNLGERPYLLSLCAMDERKNLVMLLKAFALVCVQQPQFEALLVLAGPVNSNAISRLDEIASHLGIRNRLVLTGFVPDEDLAPLYSGALSFLFPSLSEGFGLPPLEAMQCGLPVISSNATSLPEVVGNSGVLLDPNDIDAWAAAIFSLYEDNGRREQLQEMGLRRASSFSWGHCAKEHLEIYRTVLSRKSSRSIT